MVHQNESCWPSLNCISFIDEINLDSAKESAGWEIHLGDTFLTQKLKSFLSQKLLRRFTDEIECKCEILGNACVQIRLDLFFLNCFHEIDELVFNSRKKA